jgi:hypothetical protein
VVPPTTSFPKFSVLGVNETPAVWMPFPVNVNEYDGVPGASVAMVTIPLCGPGAIG